MLRHGGAVCQGVKNDLLPQVILISPSLIQQDQSARKTIKSSMVLVVTSVPETPIGPKKPEVFLVPELALDGSSLCMECDVIVHAGGKRSHERYLLLRQKIEFLGDKPGHFKDLMLQHHDNTKDRLENNILLHKKQFLENIREKMDRCRMPPVSI